MAPGLAVSKLAGCNYDLQVNQPLLFAHDANKGRLETAHVSLTETKKTNKYRVNNTLARRSGLSHPRGMGAGTGAPLCHAVTSVAWEGVGQRLKKPPVLFIF